MSYPTQVDTTTTLLVPSNGVDGPAGIRHSRHTSSTSKSTSSISISTKYTKTIPTRNSGGPTPTTTGDVSVSRTSIIASTPPHTPVPSTGLTFGLSSGPAPTTTRDTPAIDTSIIAPTPTETSDPTQTSGGVVSHSNHGGAFIGGVLGGLAFLALTLSLTFLYCRHRGARWAPIFARYRLGGDRERARIGAALLPVSLPFRRRRVQSLIVVPMPHDEGYQPPESKRERLQRVRAEMEEARRLCEDLEHRSMNTVNTPGDDGVENGLERAEAVAIRAQIEQMSAMIAGLQAEVQRLVLPPDYSAAVGP